MLAADEIEHDFFELAFVGAAVCHDQARLRHDLVDARGHVLDRLDPVVHEVDLAAAVQLAQDRLLDRLAVPVDRARLDRVAVGGRRVDDAQVAQALSAMYSVRGIGVAVCVSTSTLARSDLIFLLRHAEALLFV